MTPATTSSAPSGNRWLVLVAMTGSLSMIMLDQTVVTVALPSMARELPLSPTGQQWIRLRQAQSTARRYRPKCGTVKAIRPRWPE